MNAERIHGSPSDLINACDCLMGKQRLLQAQLDLLSDMARWITLFAWLMTDRILSEREPED